MSKLVLVTSAIALSIASPAMAVEMLVNGNFESGLSGWARIDQIGSSGSWLASANGGNAPISGNAVPALSGGGNFIALTDSTGPGSHQLWQSFFATAGDTYLLSFDAYANDQSGAAPVGTGLDYTTSLNQHIEINLPGAPPIFSGTFTPSWARYSYDISSLITSSGSYTLSFGQVDNLSPYNFGLDNVSLQAVTGVPEASTWAMMLTGFGLLGWSIRRCRPKIERHAS